VSENASQGSRSARFDPDRIRFVLVEPQFAGNVGAAARALMNLDFSHLHLVRPACDPVSRDARTMAVGAAGLLERAEVHDSLDGALSGASTVVGTSRRTGRQRRPHWRLDLLSPQLVLLGRSGVTALVFGREDHGLDDEQLDRCTHLVHLPGASAYPSFNLAQSVLLVAYELRRAALAPPAEPPLPPPASHELREGLYAHLAQALRTIGFLGPETATAMMRKFRRLFGRAAVTDEEVQLLRGVARQILWASRRAGLEVADGPEARGASPDPP